MTNGTSQGLNIVLGIVIFGVFVLMAYILFEDTLSPALAGMFSDATETAKDRLNKPSPLVENHTKNNLVNTNDTSPHPTEWFLPDVHFKDGSDVLVKPYEFMYKDVWGEKPGENSSSYLYTLYDYKIAHQSTFHYLTDTYKLQHTGKLRIQDLDGFYGISVSMSLKGDDDYEIVYEEAFTGNSKTLLELDLATYDSSTPLDERNVHYIIEVMDTLDNLETLETYVRLRDDTPQ